MPQYFLRTLLVPIGMCLKHSVDSVDVNILKQKLKSCQCSGGMYFNVSDCFERLPV